MDGDTIIIDKVSIRLAGIDAPELDHPFGKQAMWALVKLCKGHRVTAHIKPEMSYDRVVAQCFLPDGRDLAAEMVRLGLAIDWPKFSGGKYRDLEPEGVRKRLWRAAVRQRGMASLLDDLTPVAPQRADSRATSTAPIAPSPARRWEHDPAPVVRLAARRRAGRSLFWLVVPCLLLTPVGCMVINAGSPSHTRHGASVTYRPTATPDIYEVTAAELNVRSRPSGTAQVISQVAGGSKIVSNRVSGRWHAILLQDGRTGWVYGDFLRPVAE
ncbi:thermonuclease family protein [Devosia sediminis]|uniref:Thermonuclease family protein n=1 Tax=Devosia sediminis TaxID=2798801 RepID=A0A934MRT8_9HYPH|nr:thermonuclease family protein [Devosia sediminis]MBJ3785764.1 thermonuclease family protein [Devosia sediminis]